MNIIIVIKKMNILYYIYKRKINILFIYDCVNDLFIIKNML